MGLTTKNWHLVGLLRRCECTGGAEQYDPDGIPGLKITQNENFKLSTQCF